MKQQLKNLLIASLLLFIFACHSSARFTFRKKVNVKQQNEVRHQNKEIKLVEQALEAAQVDSSMKVTVQMNSTLSGIPEKLKLGSEKHNRTLNQNKKQSPEKRYHTKTYPNPDSTKINAAALIGFSLSLIGSLGTLMMSTAIFNNSDITTFFAFLLITFIGLIISSIGLFEIKIDPEVYKGKYLAIAGLIMSGLIVLAFLFFLALFLLYIGAI